MYIQILLGTVLIALAAMLLILPKACFDFGHKYFLSSKFQYAVGIASPLLGVALYFSSAASKHPSIFEFIGLCSFVAGVICLVLPRTVFRNIVSWELKTFSPYGRLLAVFYSLAGGFTIYTAI
jgi:hypothetical protein